MAPLPALRPAGHCHGRGVSSAGRRRAAPGSPRSWPHGVLPAGRAIPTPQPGPGPGSRARGAGGAVSSSGASRCWLLLAGPGPAASRGPPWVLVLAGGGGGVARSWRGLAAAPARPPWGSELAVAHGRCRAGRRLGALPGRHEGWHRWPGRRPRPGRHQELRPAACRRLREAEGLGGGLSSAPGSCPGAGPQADGPGGGEAPR